MHGPEQGDDEEDIVEHVCGWGPTGHQRVDDQDQVDDGHDLKNEKIQSHHF